MKFLKYVEAGKEEAEQDFKDAYVKTLQESVKQIKDNRTMKERYMIWQEMLRDERNQGREEGREEGIALGEIKYAKTLLYLFLDEKGVISESLSETIFAQTDLATLNEWIKIALKTTSIEQFLKEI